MLSKGIEIINLDGIKGRILYFNEKTQRYHVELFIQSVWGSWFTDLAEIEFVTGDIYV